MLTIGVIGANGQVGSEVCLALDLVEGVRVVPLCRTELGGAFLRRCGLSPRNGTLDAPERSRALLAACDVVADFSLPGGRVSEFRGSTRRTLENACLHAPPGAAFVYASTMMAFGIPATSRVFRPHLFAHTSYGANKRFGERVAKRSCRRAGRPLYVLRLGQVHGELQAVSRLYLRTLGEEPTQVSNAPSYTVFVPTIAEALVAIGRGQERPGTYTVVSDPEWTWREVHEHFCQRAGIAPRILSPGPERDPGGWSARVRRAVSAMAGGVSRIGMRRRDLATGYLLPAFPEVEHRLMAAYYTRQARSDIAELTAPARVSTELFGGRIPGRRLRSITDSRATLEPVALRIRERVEAATARGQR